MRYLPAKTIEARATSVLRDANALRVPVPVELVAHRLGLIVEPSALGDDVSGLLVVRDGRGTIGVNQGHPPVRQRFTVAHEIGHYMLHRTSSNLFIDKAYTAVYRDTQSSTGEERAEIQANHFAAALLMPADLLLPAIRGSGFDLADEEALEMLAEKFQVSLQSLSYRLSNLGIFPTS
jgi:Zn-dependent peptidase ImmA (M78 family)